MSSKLGMKGGETAEAVLRAVIFRQIQKGKELIRKGWVNPDDYQAWSHTTRSLFSGKRGNLREHVKKFDECGYQSPLASTPEGYEERAMKDAVVSQLKILESIIDVLEVQRALETEKPSKSRKKVFIVHGRAEAPKQSLARFLEHLKLTPVILHEHVSLGRTIIQKFRDLADVAFAVILLTGDDRGGLGGKRTQNLRARQNVIFEFGYFLGRLGPDFVCALYEEGVEKPSDLDGIVYIPLDREGAWKMSLAREMKSAGLGIDLNRLVNGR